MQPIALHPIWTKSKFLRKKKNQDIQVIDIMMNATLSVIMITEEEVRIDIDVLQEVKAKRGGVFYSLFCSKPLGKEREKDSKKRYKKRSKTRSPSPVKKNRKKGRDKSKSKTRSKSRNESLSKTKKH